MSPDPTTPLLRTSLRSRTLAAVLLAVMPVVAAFGWAGTRAAERALEDEVARTLTAVAHTLAAQWERAGEAPRVARLGPDSHATRDRLTASLEATRNAAAVRRIRIVDHEHATLLDTQPSEPFATAFDLAQDQAALRSLFAHATAARSTLFTAADGTPHLRAFAPLRDDTAVVAAIAVEGDLTHLGLLQRLRAGLLAVLALTLAATVAATLWATSLVTRPLRRLVKAARRIGRGDLREPIAPAPDDDVGPLASAMEQMRADLARRDEQMQLMLGGIAHEIRNPLGGLRLTADLLDETGTPDAADATRRLRRDVDHLERVTEEFLAFARPRPLRRAPTDPAELARTAIESCTPLATTRHISLPLDTPPSPPTLHADAEQLRGALTNLLRNAIEASPDHATVTTSITASRTHLTLTVDDHGPGLPPDLRDRLFEPFFTTRQQGSGLGLPLVRRVVDAHRGTITLEDRPSGGTRAVLSIPIQGGTTAGSAEPANVHPGQRSGEGGDVRGELGDGAGEGVRGEPGSGAGPRGDDDDFLIG